jgi:carboxypeptidase Taq
MTSSTLQAFKDHALKIRDLSSIAGLLQWDQEVMMPTGGFQVRSRQLAELTGQIHDLQTSTSWEDSAAQLAEDPDITEKDRVNARMVLRDIQQAKKLPKPWVIALNTTISRTFEAWIKGRENGETKVYLEALRDLVRMKQEEAAYLGFVQHPYDALLDPYEPGLTTQKVTSVLGALVEGLKLPGFSNATDGQAAQAIPGPIATSIQKKFGRALLEHMGYDFSKGRMDVAPHPFCIGLHAGDVRVTHQCHEDQPDDLVWGLLHEGGHALYELGLPEEEAGLPAGSARSLVVHESQSRLWENHIGKSQAFWKGVHQEAWLKETGYPLPPVADMMPQLHRMQPNLIRIQADEYTYHFHIWIRFQIEKQLIEGSLAIQDVEACWNDLYEQWLGLRPPQARQGFMQDIHWAHGSFGYFPTYSLGSMMAAQLFESVASTLHLESLDQLEASHLSQVKAWLHAHIYQHGGLYSSDQLCQMATGKVLEADALLRHLKRSFQSHNPTTNETK